MREINGLVERDCHHVSSTNRICNSDYSYVCGNTKGIQGQYTTGHAIGRDIGH